MAESLDAGLPHSAPASLQDAILALDTALERRLRYPDAHPVVGASRDAFVRAWEQVLGELGTTSVSVAADRLGWGEPGGPVLPGVRPRALARLLHSMHMTALTVQAEASDKELLALLDLVHGLRNDARPFQAIQTWTRDSGVRAVRVTALDMDDLTYTDRRLKAPPEDSAGRLQRYLAEPAEDAATAAREILENWRGREMLGLAAVRAELLQRLQSAKPGEERALSERILKLLAAFPEPVRADLLRIHTPDGTSMFAQLVRPLPPRDALTALLELGRLDGRLPRGTTAILTQILHCLPDGDRVAADIAEDADAGTVAAALQSMFANRAENEYNPEDYQQRLDELARQENLRGSEPSARTRVLEDAPGLAAAAGAIAAVTLDGAAADEEGPMLERLDRALPALLERRRTDLVAIAARAVRARDAAARREGAALATRIAGSLPALLAATSTSAQARADLRDILALLPADKVAHEAMRQLLAGGTEPHADLLRSLLLDADGKVLASLLATTVEKMPERIARVRALLRDGRSPEVRALLDRLKNHADRRIRTTALAVLVERDGASEHHEALTGAVTGPDADHARWALQCLAGASNDEGEVTGFLGWLLEKQRGLSSDIRGRIIASLLERGEAGRHRAAAALIAVSASPGAASARLGRRLVAQLGKHGTDPEVARAIRCWQRSPARWLGGLADLWSGGRR